MKIGLAQVSCILGDKQRNLERMEEVVSEADAETIVFPELFTTGYMCRDLFYLLAEEIDGESVRSISAMAESHDRAIIFGIPLKHSRVPGILTNSAVCATPDGAIQRYDKLFLPNFGPFEEKLYFGHGTAPEMFEVGGFRLGMVICYDLFFPEIARHYALQGADAIVCISAGPSTSRSFFERLVPARAIENAAYCLYVNQVGTQLNQVFFGGSHAYSPRGELLGRCELYREDVKVVELSAEELESARRFRPTIKDAMSARSGWASLVARPLSVE